ncbi:hypothetical protein OUZ56_013267 [Daphnia magna]|uniref:GMP synthase n=1 Tax=Daphnia magna TaxID=35525 RepID=A0ABQ9Z5D7_9CRUS|nr:hypothetical protein OUZ56_013267 [Daphnia magna]
MEADFGETQVLIRLMVDYANMAAKKHALLNRIEIATSEEERILLEELSSRNQYVATLLPICAVGVQEDCRTYSYCVALSSDQTQPNWNDLATYARLMARVCHNVDRVCYIFRKADFTTGLPTIPDTHLPQEVVDKMVETVLSVSGISRVLYDLTSSCIQPDTSRTQNIVLTSTAIFRLQVFSKYQGSWSYELRKFYLQMFSVSCCN